MKQQAVNGNEAAARTTRFSELFASMVNHELRNALNAVSTAASLLELRADNEKIATPATRIARSASRMERMLSQLVDFTRIELDGALVLIREPIDLLELIQTTLEELPADQKARVAIKTEDDVQGRWDRDRLAQLLSTLVSNALQHGAPDGHVRIWIQAEPAADETIMIAVESDGEVSPEVLENLFVPKRRPTSINTPSGLGLGLYIAQHVALAHGGQLDVRSAQGRTRFTLSLPAQPTATSRPPLPTTKHA